MAAINAEYEASVLEIEIRMDRDTHLERCDLAKRGGPDATLACDECGRARWMHRTRHDTCGSFCYVTVRSISDDQIMQLRCIPTASHEIKLACAKALNEFGVHAPTTVRDARKVCAAEINRVRNAEADTAKRARED